MALEWFDVKPITFHLVLFKAVVVVFFSRQDSPEKFSLASSTAFDSANSSAAQVDHGNTSHSGNNIIMATELWSSIMDRKQWGKYMNAERAKVKQSNMAKEIQHELHKLSGFCEHIPCSLQKQLHLTSITWQARGMPHSLSRTQGGIEEEEADMGRPMLSRSSVIGGQAAWQHVIEGIRAFTVIVRAIGGINE
jgi:hypothetical protein